MFDDGTSVITVDLFFTCRKKIWYNVKRFFSRLLNPDISLGARDYYVPMLFFDILCFLTIIFGVASFGVSYTYVRTWLLQDGRCTLDNCNFQWLLLHNGSCVNGMICYQLEVEKLQSWWLNTLQHSVETLAKVFLVTKSSHQLLFGSNTIEFSAIHRWILC